MARRLAWLSAFVVTVAIGFLATYRGSSSSSASPPARPDDPAQEGRRLFLRDCAVCHRPQGEGSSRGPNLAAAGTAAVDFMIRTGRMPLSSPDAPLKRHRVRYDETEIDAIDAYAAAFTHGPAIPDVHTRGANLRQGNELYRDQCAACHQAAGAGGSLAYGVQAPALTQTTPRETVEAMRIGPGRMPQFDPATIDDREAAEVAAYVKYLRRPEDPGGLNLGHLGPVPEGLVAWLLGLGVMLLIARLLGVRVGQRGH